MSTAAILAAYRRALGRESHVLARSPDLTWQQLHNRLQWCGDTVEPYLERERARRSQAGCRPWIRTRTPLPESEALLRTIPARGSIAFAPGGATLLGIDPSSTLTVWDVATGVEIRTMELKGPDGSTATPAFVLSPDGAFIVSRGPDGNTSLWETSTGRQRLRGPVRDPGDPAGSGDLAPEVELQLAAHTRFACAVSPDGTFVAEGHADGVVRVWDTGGGIERHAVRAHDGPVTACAVSPDGAFIASAGIDGTVRRWDLATGSVHAFAWEPGGDRPATRDAERDDVGVAWDCAIAPDASFVVGLSDDRIAVWDTATGELRWRRWYFQPFDVDCAKGCVVSPDGTFVVVHAEGRLLRLWDPSTGDVVSTLAGHTAAVHACAISPDGTLLASIAGDGVRLWDARVRGEPEPIGGHGDRVTSCAFDPAGRHAASTSADGRIVVWSADSRLQERVLAGHVDAVQDCAFTPDGSRLVSAGRDGSVRLWDPGRGEELRRWGFDDPAWGCAVHPDGAQLLVGTGDHPTFLDVADDGGVIEGAAGGGEVWGCAYAPDGSWAVTSSEDGSLVIWDPDTAEVRTTLTGHEGLVGVCAVSPSGGFIVSGGRDTTVRIWDAHTGAPRRVLRGHTDAVWGCAVSPNDRYVLSSSWDATVRCWDVDTGVEVARLPLPARAHGTAWRRSGSLAASGDVLGTVHFFETVGLAMEPIAVTPRLDDEHLSIRCPACDRDEAVDRDSLGVPRTCRGCGVALLPSPSPLVRLSRRPVTSPRGASRPTIAEMESAEQDLLRATKTCWDCGTEFELLRTQCPRCGSIMASMPSAEATEFMQQRQVTATRHVDQGSRLFQQGHLDEAETEFRAAIEANPWNATAHGNLGVVMMRRGRPDEAVHCFERAVEIDPGIPGGQSMLAAARAQQR